MRDNYIRLAEGFLVVYSITDRNSFDQVEMFVTHIYFIKEDNNVPIILVGSKKDLDGDRQVKKSEGKSLAERYSIPFYETSAKTDFNVTRVFGQLVKRVQEYKKSEKKKRKKNQNICQSCLLN